MVRIFVTALLNVNLKHEVMNSLLVTVLLDDYRI